MPSNWETVTEAELLLQHDGADERRAEHVGPVDRRVRLVEVAGQPGRGLEHRRVVLDARGRALLRGSVRALTLEDRRVGHKVLQILACLHKNSGGSWAPQP